MRWPVPLPLPNHRRPLMRKLYGFTLTAMFTLVAMAPNTAAAIPVPLEDVVPPECTEGLSSVCADEITVPGLVVGPGGIAPGEITAIS